MTAPPQTPLSEGHRSCPFCKRSPPFLRRLENF